MLHAEHGGIVRKWNHTLHVEQLGERTCKYSDTVDIEAGTFTSLVAEFGTMIYLHRQRRWHRLVHKHPMPEGPAYARFGLVA